MTEQPSHSSTGGGDTFPTTPAQARSRRGLRWLGAALAVVLLLVVAGAIWAGYQAGLGDRATQARATQSAELQLQFQLGSQDLQAGRYAIAVERFKFIVELDSQYPGAAEKLAQAQQFLQLTLTPASTRAAPTSTPTPVLATTGQPEILFAQAQKFYSEKNWEGVIVELTALHAVSATYESSRTNGMLLVALQQRGIARIVGDEMESGMADIEAASAFGPLEDEAINYSAWGRLYLAASSYWGVNWQETTDILSQLYVLAPNFKDTAQRLRQSVLNYAAQLEQSGDPCAAAEQYIYVYQLFPEASIAEKLAAAQNNCALQPTATPTVLSAEITPTP